MEGATQGTARLLVERLAQAAQAAAPLDWDNPLAEAFCMLRLEPRGVSIRRVPPCRAGE